MKYKDYSTTIWQSLHSTLDLVLKQDPHPVAVFDADGTLWDTDLGETFFHHQIDHKLVPLPPHPWEHYQDLKKKNPNEAYLWLAQICRDQPLSVVRDWAEKAVAEIAPVPLFSEQQKLIELFLQKGVQVFVVTASVKWAVEPGAKMLGLGYDQVIGVETETPSGVISDKQKGFISYREGKVKALLAHTNGKKPFFASGNTMGDFDLLGCATHLRLAVSAASRDDRLFKTEFELAEHAIEKGWLNHRFV